MVINSVRTSKKTRLHHYKDEFLTDVRVINGVYSDRYYYYDTNCGGQNAKLLSVKAGGTCDKK
jgi:hypothetical protein